jgi:hypothetical protein
MRCDVQGGAMLMVFARSALELLTAWCGRLPQPRSNHVLSSSAVYIPNLSCHSSQLDYLRWVLLIVDCFAMRLHYLRTLVPLLNVRLRSIICYPRNDHLSLFLLLFLFQTISCSACCLLLQEDALRRLHHSLDVFDLRILHLLEPL